MNKLILLLTQVTSDKMRKIIPRLVALSSLALFFTSCTTPPIIITSEATYILGTSLTLNGEITSDGGSTVTKRGFVYSTTNIAPTIGGAGTEKVTTDLADSTGKYTKSIIDLVPGTEHYIRAYAINAEGASYGGVKMFTTLRVSPSVTSYDATNILGTSVTLKGEVTSDGGSAVTQQGFVYSTTNIAPTIGTAGTEKVTADLVANSTGKYTKSITDLTFGTKYYVRTYAINAEGTSYGDVKTFWILGAAPVYIEDYIETGTSLGFGVNIDGVWWAPVNVGYTVDNPFGLLFYWGKNEGFEYKTRERYTAHESWAEHDQGPCPNGWRVPTKYEYYNLLGIPKAEYNAPSNPETDDTEIDGHVNHNYETYEYGSADSQWYDANAENPNGVAGRWFGPDSKTATVTTPGNSIFFPAAGYLRSNWGSNEIGTEGYYWSSADDRSLDFSSYAGMRKHPNTNNGHSVRCVYDLTESASGGFSSAVSVTTSAVTDILGTSVTLNGEVSFAGGSFITQQGFVYSTIKAIEGTEKVTTDLTEGTSKYSKTITDLALGKYYVRAYVLSSEGISYGNINTFWIMGSAPVYVENGSSLGFGISIDGLWWAPVNVGYTADNPRGLLFNWGKNEGVKSSKRESAKDGDWADIDQGPCPDGWRVPTKDEYYNLSTGKRPLVSIATRDYPGQWREANANNPNGLEGRWFGPDCETATVTTPGNSIFFPDGHNYWSSTSGSYFHFGDLLAGVSSTSEGYNLLRCVTNGLFPLVTTSGVSDILDTSVTLKGEVSSDGTSAITQRGFVYSTINTILTTSGAGTEKVIADLAEGIGKYKKTITNLALDTKYYGRAYAINAKGTSYGDVRMFPCPTYIENGSSLGFGIEIDGLWWAPVNVGYTADNPYGLLFNWGKNKGFEYGSIGESATDGSWAEHDQGPCPDGWRVPTRDEYYNLCKQDNHWSDASAENPDGLSGHWFGSNCQVATKTNPGGAIFFPATGWWGPWGQKGTNSEYSKSRDYMGSYWSGTYARLFRFNRENHAYMENRAVEFGFSVRCVQD